MRIVPKKTILLFAAFLTLPVTVFAADPPPPQATPPPPPGTPIDSYIIALITTSILFGLYKINASYKTKASK